MNVVCCQLDIAWENKPANYKKVELQLEKLQPPAASLVVLPEMFSTGFSMNVAAIGEAQNGSTEAFLSKQAQRFGVFIVGGVVVIQENGLGENQAVVFNPEGHLIARYSKTQPFTLGGEMDHYSPGRKIALFRWEGFTVAPFVCYDLRFPELFRIASQQGADMLVVIANWPVARVEHWLCLLQARAIENQAYVVGVNRCGRSPEFLYPGRSVIIDPHGTIIADASAFESAIQGRVHPELVHAWRQEFPALRDARRDYHQLGIELPPPQVANRKERAVA